MQEKFTVLIYILWAAAKKRSLQEFVALSSIHVCSHFWRQIIFKREEESLCTVHCALFAAAAAAASFQKTTLPTF